ncbi:MULTISPECIES: hypothetical protein [Agrobacterium tumefaciens complex]|uniref:Uncharacterized protein n=1 Tax=Agrobacterium tomkonis CFBP 6623 TaxID=1183432 RepID=A0A1S7SBD4_9HYPH|nr:MULTISPECIES: hypothetical protein [Agrobacterium tumefaciens complex]QCL92710.1 hypothetical protein CFBP6623_26425 [Agrobacterium tumefaciens]CUX65923.1 hypothetical protein AGR3A_pb0036 [Agrobacterium tomkonis CFBP 6623]
MKWWPGRDMPNLRAMGDRARDALKAYEVAEAVYSEYRKERDALEVRYRSLIGRWWGEYEAGHLSPMDRYSVERELAAISTGIVELVQPMHHARVALEVAQQEIRAVLQAAGFALPPDDLTKL